MNLKKSMLIGALMICVGQGVSVVAQSLENGLTGDASSFFTYYNAQYNQTPQKGVSLSEAFGLSNDLFKNNLRQTVSICDASPETHRCLSRGIRIKTKVQSTDVSVFIPSFTMLSVENNPMKEVSSLTMAYQLLANGIFPQCQTARTKLEKLSDANQLVMTPTATICQLTNASRMFVSVEYNLDYFDIDKKTIGGYYVLQAGNPDVFEQKGYALMRFPEGLPLPKEEMETEDLPTETVDENRMKAIPAVVAETEPSEFVLTETKATLKTRPNPTAKTTVKTEEKPATENAGKQKDEGDVVQEVSQTAVPMKTIKTTVTERTIIVPEKGKERVVLPSTRTEISSLKKTNDNGAVQ